MGSRVAEHVLGKHGAGVPRTDDGNVDLVHRRKAHVQILVMLLVDKAGGEREQGKAGERGHDVPDADVLTCSIADRRADKSADRIGKQHGQVRAGIGVAPHIVIDACDKSHAEHRAVQNDGGDQIFFRAGGLNRRGLKRDQHGCSINGKINAGVNQNQSILALAC